MPRPFTGTEKEEIRAKLLETGLACFTRYGLKKTTIEDLVKPAKISKAAFYHFFDSKEALYAELLLERFPAMQRRIVERSLRATDDVHEAIERFQLELVKEMEADALIQPIVVNPAELEQIIHGVPDGLRGIAALDLGAPVLEWIRDAQARGDIIEGDPETVLGVLGLVKFLPTHQDDIDPVLYPKLLLMMTHVVANGLTRPKSPEKKKASSKRAAPKKAGKAAATATSKNQPKIPGRAPGGRLRAPSKQGAREVRV